jgi:cytochrome b561
MSSFDQPAAAARYSKVAAWLHWLIGLGVIANILIAELTEDFAKPERYQWMGLHMAIGITILLLTLVRIYWRLTHRPPPQPMGLPGWQVAIGKTVHFIFYLLLIGLPLGGWLWMSARAEPVVVSMFGLFDWPVLPVGENKALGDVLHEGHELGGKVMIVLVLLHFAGALKHQFVDRTRYIGRMNPFG